MNSIINFTDKLSYFSAKLIKKIEKKFGITLYYFFPLRLFLRMYEVIFFKKINDNFVEFSNYYLPQNVACFLPKNLVGMPGAFTLMIL